MRNKKIILLSLVFLLAIAFASAQQPTIMGLQGRVVNKTTGVAAEGDLIVNVTSTTGADVYNETFSNAVINGLFDVELGSNPANSMNLSFNQDYNLTVGVLINGETFIIGKTRIRGGQGEVATEDIKNNTITTDDISTTADITDEQVINDITIQSTKNITTTQNISLGQVIGFALGAIIDNVINGVLNIGADLRVQGDINATQINATTFYGDGSQLTGVAVTGNTTDEMFAAVINGTFLIFADSLMNNTILDMATSNTTKEMVDAVYQFFINAANITAGIFGTGDYVIQGNLNATGNITVGTGTVFIDGTNSRVGIGTTEPTSALHVEGNVSVSGNVNATGGLIMGKYATKPSCNADTHGMLVFDTTEAKPYVCNSSAWKPLDSDYDSDGITDAIDTNDGDDTDATATAADVRTGETFYAGGAAVTGSMSDCSGASGTNICYANTDGEWHDAECVESTAATQTECFVDDTARYLTTDLCDAAKENQCFVNTVNGYYAFGGECVDSTTTEKTNCYVDDTAKYVNTNACSAASNTGYCYVNTATLTAMDADITSGDIRATQTIFGITGDSNVVDTSTGDAIAGEILSGKKGWVDGSEITGSIANCNDGDTSCYASGGVWASDGNCNSQGDQSCRTTGTYYGATTCSGAAGQQTCYVASSGEWHDDECADSSGSTTTECYIDNTAKYVDSNTCSAGSSTGLCYMHQNFNTMDSDLTAANIVSGTVIFGITGTAGSAPGCGVGASASHGPDAVDYCDNDHDGTVDEEVDTTTLFGTTANPTCGNQGWDYSVRLISPDSSSATQWCIDMYGATAQVDEVSESGTCGDIFGNKCCIYSGGSWRNDLGSTGTGSVGSITCRDGPESSRFD